MNRPNTLHSAAQVAATVADARARGRRRAEQELARPAQRAAAQAAFETRWQGAVASYGETLWAAADWWNQSAFVRDVLGTFLSCGDLSPAQVQALANVTAMFKSGRLRRVHQ